MVEYAAIGNAKLAYRLTGPADGPLIITLHGGRGFGSHSSDFKAYHPLSSSYRVLSFDFRGHGQSSRTEPYTFNQLVEDIEGMRRHVLGDNHPCIICGGSFGGFLAQQYAITYPSMVSHLILRGTAPSYHHEEMAIRTLEKRASKAPNFSVKFLRDGIFGKFDSDLEFRLVMYAAAPLYSESFDPEAALKANINTVFYAKSHNQLQSITAKTLIIVGEFDWICPKENSEDIASRVPGAHLAVIANANHAVHQEKNAEVIDLIRNHLA
ncbi:Alpha/beta hydrolase fold-1 [Penicillium taxi]|uniref:Alpha/beta hydrolase fold-1 n=1 Tax=Penicillium taxi TaxID=168475 RepID=UPI002544FEDD|nr:Alpha/beta hydrolase fold-1 [Penicillium taxi]KAJ5893854.1 Alpha/beta hydrolase fold-1 [Penicillium taxi]